MGVGQSAGVPLIFFLESPKNICEELRLNIQLKAVALYFPVMKCHNPGGKYLTLQKS